MEINEVRQNLRSGYDMMAEIPVDAARREVVGLHNGNLVATVNGLLSLLAINSRQIDESIKLKLDTVAEGGRFTKTCLDGVIGVDPEYPGFSEAGEAAGAVHKLGKRTLQQVGEMKVNYANAQVFLERALSALDLAAQKQEAILSELTGVSQNKTKALHGIHMLAPDL